VEARIVSVIALTVLLAAPAAMGAWSAKGALEPDTVHDTLSPFTRLTPDRDPSPLTNLLYFNGFGSAGGAATTTLNPNLATLQTSFAATPFLAVALLGVWKDCNGDGFVGLGDNGALEYRAELLVDTSVCPIGTPDAQRPWMTRNDGRWVIEFTPVGYDDITTPEDEDPYNINATQTRVWADWGLATEPPSPACATVPAPRGTFRSTGGLLGYADCFLGFRGTAAINDAAAAAGQPQLGFSDAPPGQPERSTSPLNAPNPWGSESDAALARGFDCAQSFPVVVPDPTGGGLDAISDDEGNVVSLTLRRPAPTTDPNGSPAGTVNETESQLDDCDRSDTDEVVDLDGRRTGSDGDLPYALEGAAASSAPDMRRSRSDHVLAFEEGSRDDAASALLGARTREHAGLGLASVTGFWVGTGAGTVSRNVFVSRQALGAEPVSYITYYAFIDDGTLINHTLQIPGGGSRYGNEGCSAGTFECDERAWWSDASGADITPRDSRLGVDPSDPTVPAQTDETRIGVRVGQWYNLRDVDCIDTSFGAARAGGAHWGRLTGTRCERP
jgi:hypothetical protein